MVNKVTEESQAVAHLPSNRGHRLTIFQIDFGPPLKLRINTVGTKESDRIEDLLEHIHSRRVIPPRELEFDHRIGFSNIERTNLADFVRALESWVERREPLNSTLLADAPRLSVTIQPDPRLISSTDKPVFQMGYESTASDYAVRYVIEESCVRLLIEDLQRIVKRAGEGAVG